MALKVDPRQLAALAEKLNQAVEQAKGGVPTETDTHVEPPGGDPISIAGAARLSAQGTQLANLATEALNKLAAGGYQIGAAGEGYSRADVDGRNAIAGAGGGEVVPNPVPFPTSIPLRTAPTASADVPTYGIDEGEFATLLERGAGVGALERFLGSWADVYGYNTHPAIGQAVFDTTTGVQDWSEVGTETVAPLLQQFRGWHDELGTAVFTLAQRAADFLEAYKTVEKTHPSKETIEQAKQRVQQATTPQEQAAALQDLRQVQQRAQDAQQQYATTVRVNVPDNGFGLGPPPDIANPTSTAVNNEIPSRLTSGPEANGANTTTAAKSDSNQTGADNGEGTNNGNEDLQNLLSSLENALGNSEATDPVAAQAQNTGAGNQNQSANSNPADLSQLANSLNPNQGQNAGLTDGLPLDEPLGDLPPLDYETSGLGGGYGGGGFGGGGFGGVRNPDTRTAALSGTANSVAAPRLASATPQFGSAAPGGSQRGFGGMGGYPFMPMAPGMGGLGGNGNGDRKDPFAEQQKIVDDDELRSRPGVHANWNVNEKPPVVPDATKETVLIADRKSATNQGGTHA